MENTYPTTVDIAHVVYNALAKYPREYYNNIFII